MSGKPDDFLGAARIERYMAWDLLGTGKVRGAWAIADRLQPESWIELHYDASGLLLGIREWLEGETQPVERRLTLDSAGRLVQSERTGPDPAVRNRNSYKYDARGMLCERQEVELATGTVHFRTLSKCNAQGVIIENAMHDGQGVLKERSVMEVDAHGRCLKETKYTGAQGMLIGHFVFVRDALGRETRRTWHDQSGRVHTVTDTQYDSDNRPVLVTLTVTGHEPRTMVMTYTPTGKKASVEVRDLRGKRLSATTPSAAGPTWRKSFVTPTATERLQARRFAEPVPPLPADANGLIRVAYSHFEAERYADALPLFEQVAAAHPEDVYALSAVAACALKLGRFEQARQWYERALALAPEHPQCKRGYELVRRALGSAAK